MKGGVAMTFWLAVWAFFKLTYKIIKAAVKTIASIVIFFGLYIPLFYLVFGLVLLIFTDFSFGGSGTNQTFYYIGFGLCCAASVIISIRNLLVRPISSVVHHVERGRDDGYRRGDARRNRDDRYDDSEDRRRGRRDDYYRYDDSEDRRRGRRDDYYRYDDSEDRRRGRRDDYYRDDDRRDERRRRQDGSHRERDYRYSDYDEEMRYGDERDGASRRQSYGRHGYSDYNAHYERDISEERTPRNFDDLDEKPYRNERPLVYYSKRRPDLLIHEFSDRFEIFKEENGAKQYVGTEYKDD